MGRNEEDVLIGGIAGVLITLEVGGGGGTLDDDGTGVIVPEKYTVGKISWMQKYESTQRVRTHASFYLEISVWRSISMTIIICTTLIKKRAILQIIIH